MSNSTHSWNVFGDFGNSLSTLFLEKNICKIRCHVWVLIWNCSFTLSVKSGKKLKMWRRKKTNCCLSPGRPANLQICLANWRHGERDIGIILKSSILVFHQYFRVCPNISVLFPARFFSSDKDLSTYKPLDLCPIKWSWRENIFPNFFNFFQLQMNI